MILGANFDVMPFSYKYDHTRWYMLRVGLIDFWNGFMSNIVGKSLQDIKEEKRGAALLSH